MTSDDNIRKVIAQEIAEKIMVGVREDVKQGGGSSRRQNQNQNQ